MEPRTVHERAGAVLAAVLVVLLARAGWAENWPQWRGPTGDGIATETTLPTTWSESAGIAWKCPLPEWGDSTPIIWGDAIFVTSHVDDQRLVLLKIKKASGQIEWTREVGAGSARRAAEGGRGEQKFHKTQNLATPSPVTDGKTVVAHFGNGDLAAYDFAGRRLWKRNLQDDFGPYTIWWGHGNSPVIAGNLVVSVSMQDSLVDLGRPVSPSYVVAHDLATGELRWKTPRPTTATAESCDSYTTPIFRESAGRREMIVYGGQILDAYDPATGRRLWSLSGLGGNRVIPSPVAAQGMIFAVQGMREPLLGVRIGGQGDRPADDIIWQSEKGTSDSPSLVAWDDLVFMVTNNGILQCFEAETGKVLWKDRIKGEYRASPVAAEGRIYFLNMTGLTTVVAAAREFKVIAENQIDDETIASPAVSDGKIFLRGRKYLYAIGG